MQPAHFVFSGRLATEAFIAFARARAARLDLALEVRAASEEAVSLVVNGAPELVDAFEMACSLGPLDCLVLEVARHG